MKTAIDIGNEILAAETEPMDKELTGTFLLMTLSGDKPYLETEVGNTFPVKVFSMRAKSYGIEMEERMVVFFAILARNVAEVVMYVAVARALQKKLGRPLIWNDISDAFPMGFPTEEAMNTIWDNQKKTREEYAQRDRDNWMSNDNWIDETAAWEPEHANI